MILNGCKIKEDISGMIFGRLKAIEPTKVNNKVVWKCECQCEDKTIVYFSYSQLHTRNNKSCGCLNKNKNHGDSQTKLYTVWINMKGRCNNPNTTEYENYGGRGIKICNEWEYSYLNFKKWALKNGYKEDLTIDRINVDEGYYPCNCRWADRKQQGNNTTRNRIITYNNKTQTMSEWADEYNMSYYRLRKRLYDGWDIHKALTTPNQLKDAKYGIDVKKENNQLFLITQYGDINVSEMSKFLGLNKTTVSKYLQIPHTAEECLIHYSKQKEVLIDDIIKHCCLE